MVRGGEGCEEGVGETGDWGWHIWGLGLGLDDKAKPSWDRSMDTAWTDPLTAVRTVRRVNRRVLVSNKSTMEDEKASDRQIAYGPSSELCLW